MLDKSTLKNILQLPSLSRFSASHSQEEREQLHQLITKCKEEQLIMLALDISALFPLLPQADPETAKCLLRLAILDIDLSPEQLNDIFKIKFLNEWEIDNQLKSTIQQLVSEDEREEMYQFILTFRHQYFLDKRDKVRNNPLAFFERRSEHYLNMDYDRIPLFLRADYSSWNDEQRALLTKFYPPEKLNNKRFRIQTQEELKLTVFEMQSLISSMVYSWIENTQLPVDLEVKPLSGRPLHGYNIYTNQEGKLLLFKAQQIGVVGFNFLPAALSIDYHTGCSLLMDSLKLGLIDASIAMLSQGVGVSGSDTTGYTALHYAVEHDINLFIKILAAKPNLNAVDEGGYTAIYLAAEAGKIGHVKALLTAGANPNHAPNRRQYNALHIAIHKRQIEVVKLLVNSGKLDMSAKTKQGKTAYDLAKDIGGDMLVAFNTNRKEQELPKALISELRDKWLLSPSQYYSELSSIAKNFPSAKNPFYAREHVNSTKSAGEFTFANDLRAEHSAANGCDDDYKSILDFLAQFRSNPQSFATSYKLIYERYAIFRQTNLPVFVFAFELIRFGLVPHYHCLYENKTPLQVAIDKDEVDVTKQFLESNPAIQNISISYKGQGLSPIQYAILMGKVKLVAEWIEIAKNNTNIHVPDNALQLAKTRELELNGSNPAFVEAEEFLDANIATASRYSWKLLLRSLQNTVPKEEAKVVHGFFTQEEYRLISVLLAEKKQTRFRVLWDVILRWIRARKLLGDNRSNTLSGANDEATTLYEAFDRINSAEKFSETLRRTSNSHISCQPPETGAVIENVFKHATSNARLIEKDGKLTTVYDAMVTAGIKTGTPVGTRHNLFFSQNSPLAGITSFRRNASDIVELRIVEAIRQKLIAPSDIYTSPHIPAFSIERIETPIIFRGDDPNKVTVYRVYHAVNERKVRYKLHAFDYYQDGNYISSSYQELNFNQEFFQGDNIKATAYRFILLLRAIKGPFTTGSYAHYVLSNWQNARIINSAKAALFNVLNVEAKISKPISLHPSAIRIVKNEYQERYIDLPPTERGLIENHIADGNLEQLKNVVEKFNIHKEQLGFALYKAYECSRVEIFTYLLKIGVNDQAASQRILYECLEALRKHYEANSNADNGILMKKDIVRLLLLNGASDSNDPNHIAYGVAIESCVQANNAWTFVESSNFVKKLVYAFEATDMQDIIISSLTLRSCNELYQYTFKEALCRSHVAIAQRVKKVSLFETPDNQSALEASQKVLCSIFKNDIASIPGGVLTDIYDIALIKRMVIYATRLNHVEIVRILIKNLSLKANIDIVSLIEYLDVKMALELISSVNFKELDDKEALQNLLLITFKRGSSQLTAVLLNKLCLQLQDSLQLAQAIFYVISNMVRSCKPEEISTFLDCYKKELGAKSYINALLAKKSMTIAALKLKKDFYRFTRESLLNNLLRTTNSASIAPILDSFEDVMDIRKFLADSLEEDNCFFLDDLATMNAVDSIRIVLEYLPKFDTLRSAAFLGRLVSSAVRGCKDDLSLLNLLKDHGLSSTRKSEAHLVDAISRGHLAVVKWFTGNKLCEIQSVEPKTGQNLMQRIALTCGSWSKDTGACLDYLVTAGIDLNHSDINNKTLVFYTNLSSDWLLYLLNHKQIDCKQIDSNANTILHIANPSSMTKQCVEVFVSRGGDIHAVNKEGISIFENYRAKAQRIDPTMLDLFKKLNCNSRSFSTNLPHTYFILTAKVQNDFYLLMYLNHFCLFDRRVYSKRTKYHLDTRVLIENESLSLRHWHAENHQELPPFPIRTRTEDPAWIKLPKDALEDPATSYQLELEDGQSISLHLLVRLLLKGAVAKSFQVEELEQIKKLFNDCYERQYKAYLPILEGNVAELRSNFESYRQVYEDRSIPMPLRLIFFPDLNLASQSIVVYTPVEAAKKYNRKEIQEFLKNPKKHKADPEQTTQKRPKLSKHKAALFSAKRKPVDRDYATDNSDDDLKEQPSKSSSPGSN